MNANDINKNDLLNLLEEYLQPIIQHKLDFFIKEQALYNENVQKFEQFSRFLLGVTPYLYNRKNEELKDYSLSLLEGFINPDSPNYCEVTFDKYTTQLFVEMFSPLFFLYICRKQIGQEYIEKNKKHIIDWFSKIEEISFSNNWIWFQIMVNVLLYKLELKPWDSKKNELLHSKIDALYYKNGLYYDGKNGQIDYYNHFSFYFYSLIYAKIMRFDDHNNSEKYILRAYEFGKIYVSYFSDDGECVPFGRSLIYRFGVLAFLGAIVYLDEEIIPFSYIKDLLIKSIKLWGEKDIFRNGYLNIGYYYENMNIMEDYNSYGSPYWALKFFIILLSESNGFWEAPVEHFSKYKRDYIDPKLTIYSFNSEVYLFPIIDTLPYQSANFNDKYEKFVYSSLFGFNISKDSIDSTIAFDSTIAVSFDGKTYITRRNISTKLVEKNFIRSIWKINDDALITSYNIIGLPWNIRIHLIDSKQPFFMCEGAFPIKNEKIVLQKEGGWLIIKNGFQSSGIKSILGEGICKIEDMFPNTNLFFRKTSVPVCYYHIRKGKSFVVTEIFGDKKEPIYKKEPVIENYKNKEIRIVFNEELYTIKLFKKMRKNKSGIKQIERLKKTYKFVQKHF